MFYKILSIFLLAVCLLSCGKVSNKNFSGDDKSLEFYKQFDSTITKEKLVSFKGKMDEIYKWKDSKRKGHGF